MAGLEDLYREVILDHYRSPRNRGELETPPALMAEGFNPLCGDQISLYVNVDYTKHFEGMTEEESRPLLDFLYAQAVRPEFTWRHHWKVGDLVMWDNRCTLHARTDFPRDQRRLLCRITVEDSVSVAA
jgi:alpha-ketoglutarate-dependent taurine dioxygenase